MADYKMVRYKRRVSVIIPKHEYFGLWVKEDFVVNCPRYFREGVTVLDVGCGNIGIKQCLPEGVTCIGVDKDPDCDPPPDIVCDVGSIPLEDKCADTITSLGFDVYRSPGAVSEIKRLLKDGGYFIFQGSREYFYLSNTIGFLTDSGFNIEEEFRQVLRYPKVPLTFVYYICKLR